MRLSRRLSWALSSTCLLRWRGGGRCVLVRTSGLWGWCSIGWGWLARDLQKTEKQFGRCKSFDTYTPIGPFVYAEVDVNDVSLELWQNGEVRQRARTSRMIYSVGDIVSFASRSMTLLPGDVILTGTPS